MRQMRPGSICEDPFSTARQTIAEANHQAVHPRRRVPLSLLRGAPGPAALTSRCPPATPRTRRLHRRGRHGRVSPPPTGNPGHHEHDDHHSRRPAEHHGQPTPNAPMPPGYLPHPDQPHRDADNSGGGNQDQRSASRPAHSAAPHKGRSLPLTPRVAAAAAAMSWSRTSRGTCITTSAAPRA